MAAGVLLAGAGPAIASGGGNDTSAKLRKAVSVDGIRIHQAALNLFGELKDGNRLAGTPGTRALGGLRRAQREARGAQDKPAGLHATTSSSLADWKKPILDVRRGKSYIPGIAGSIPGGDFGSMVNSASGDVTGPVWAADSR